MLTLASRCSSEPVLSMEAPRRIEARHGVIVKRAREPVSSDDGMRVLVDRLWPRGVPQTGLTIDLWLREIAPSSGLRRWYRYDPRKKDEFARKYRAELSADEDSMQLLDDLRMRGQLTLLCDASDTALSHGVVLRDLLIERRFLRQTPQGERP